MFLELTPAQAAAVVGGIKAVTRYGSGDDGDPRERATVAAIARIAFRPPVDVDPDEVQTVDPSALAAAMGDASPEARKDAARLIGAAVLVDGSVDADRFGRAAAFAQALGDHEPFVRDLLESARGHLAWVHSDIVHRNLSVYPGLLEEGPTQSPKEHDPRAQAALAERYLALGDLDEGTFGRAYYEHFQANHFLFPGQSGAFAEHFAVPHDSAHVLSGYDTSTEGEMLLAVFMAAMHGDGGLAALIFPMAYFWNLDQPLNIPGFDPGTGVIDPDKFFTAWDRGAQMQADTLALDWDFWAVVGDDLDELRARYAIPALDPAMAAADPGGFVADPANRLDPDSEG